MELKARIIPWQIAMRHNTACLCGEVADQTLILHLQHVFAPARPPASAPSAADRRCSTPQLTKIIAKGLFPREQLGKAGKAIIYRITDEVNDSRVWQNRANESDKMEVYWHLVGDALAFVGQAASARLRKRRQSGAAHRR